MEREPGKMTPKNTILNTMDQPTGGHTIPEPPAPFLFEEKTGIQLLNRFQTRAKANGIRILLADHEDRVPETIAALIKGQSKRLCVCPAYQHLCWNHFPVPVYFGSNDGSFSWGVSAADGAVSQTGALVLAGHPQNPSSIGFLSQSHIFLLRASCIRASMTGILNMDRKETCALHFISGPSSTADIAGKLLIGVHGPAVVTCIIIGSA